MEDVSKQKLVTPVGRLSYPALAKARSYNNGAPSFSCSVLFEKKTGKKEVDCQWAYPAITAALTKKFGAKSDWPQGLNIALQDGDSKKFIDKKTGKTKVGYKNHWVLKSSTKEENGQPVLVDQRKNPISNEEVGTVLYPGCDVRLSVFASAYDTGSMTGVKFYLNGVQKAADNEAFGTARDTGFDVIGDEESESLGEESEEESVDF